MVRELRRLLMAPERLNGPEGEGRLALQPAEQHYLMRVLRLRRGDGVALIDGAGGLWEALLGDGAWLERLQIVTRAEAPATPSLTLALALPRREVELVWRMATELGIDRLQPLSSERTQPERQPPMERWQTVLREACEQCERLWLPALEPLETASGWLQQPRPGLALLATTRRQGLPALEQALEQVSRKERWDAGVTLAIGAEGGWSPTEEEQAIGAGWLPVSLGETILRSPTAAIAGAARLCAWRTRLHDQPLPQPAVASAASS